MPVLAEHTISTVKPHETFYVRGGGGAVQNVPWNLPADGNVRFSDGLGDGAVFGGLGALTEDEKTQLAQRIAGATFAYDIQAILEIIPTVQERQEVATRAIAIGANAQRVQQALADMEREAGLKAWLKPPPMPVRIIWGVLSTASFAACVYHGVKRNHGSLGWGLWWGFMGALFPVVAPVVAFAKAPGFAKPKPNGLGRGRTYRRRNRS